MQKITFITLALLFTLAIIPSVSSNMGTDSIRLIASQMSGASHQDAPKLVAVKVVEEDEMAKIAHEVAGILNHHEKKPEVKVVTPKKEETKSADISTDLEAAIQRDIAKMRAELAEKSAHNGMVLIPKKDTAKEDKQKEFDRIFEAMQRGQSLSEITKPKSAPIQVTKAVSTEDKYEQILEKIMREQAGKNTPEVHHVSQVAQSTKMTSDRYDAIVSQLMTKTGITRNDILRQMAEDKAEFKAGVQMAAKINNFNAPTPIHTQMSTEDRYEQIVAQMMKKSGSTSGPIPNAPKNQQVQTPVGDKYEQIVAALMKKTGITRGQIVASLGEQEKAISIPKKVEKKVEAEPVYADKYEEIVAQMMRKNGVTRGPTFEAPKAQHVQTTVSDKYEQILAQMMRKTGAQLKNKAEETSSVNCLLSYAETTAVLRKIDAKSNSRVGYTVQNVRDVRELLEELAIKVDQINSFCPENSKIQVTHPNMLTIASNCEGDFTMAGALAQIFKATQPGTKQRVAQSAKELLLVRDHMKKNC